MAAVIEARGLRYRYPDGTLALDGVDFDLQTGETVALLGANGSGKTTFVLQVAGLIEGEGQITICGIPLTKATLPAIRGRVGFVFQDSDDQLFMPTVLEDVAFGPRNLGATPPQAVETAKLALQRVGLPYAAAKAPYHLSAGEKRRASLAGVLAMNPELLILDEPTTFLDPPGQNLLARLLRELPQAKMIITHDVPFARALAQRAVFFDRGQIVGQGTVEEVEHRFGWRADY